MKTKLSYLFILIAYQSFSQNLFQGKIVAKEENETIALTGANVFWLDTTVGTITDEKGNFKIPFVEGKDQLVLSYIGYQTDTLTVSTGKLLIHFLKEDEVTNLEGITVTQGRESFQKSYLKAQNVLRINSEELLKAACCNLSESFDTNPAIDVNFSDALTGTKQIQMLGLTSPYILVSEENIPSVRGAAQAYGLTFTPGPQIESIQITKGAGSVVNGFESIAGQINTELLKPFTGQPLFVNLYTSANGRVEGNIHLTRALGDRWHTGLFIHANQRNRQTDRNKDEFLDMPLAKQINLLHRMQYTDAEKGWVGFLNLKWTDDRKQLGELSFIPGSTDFSSWGSEIDTQRWETALKIGKVNPKLSYRSWGFQASYSHHAQNAYFGQRTYDIEHESVYLNLLYNSIIGNTNTTFKTGLNVTYDAYNELVDVQRWSRTDRDVGAFFELNNSSDKLNWTVGARIDNHNNLGTFFTPRFHLRYTPQETMILRASVGPVSYTHLTLPTTPYV